jgi:hypothetical protein
MHHGRMPEGRPRMRVDSSRQRRPDPFAAVTAELRGWFEAEPWHTSRELLQRLQAQCPGVYPNGQLRTLQRRLKDWRRGAAHRMVFGTMTTDPRVAPGDHRLLGNGAERPIQRA